MLKFLKLYDGLLFLSHWLFFSIFLLNLRVDYFEIMFDSNSFTHSKSALLKKRIALVSVFQ